MNSIDKEIYNMKLGDRLKVERDTKSCGINIFIIKVPGGWIFSQNTTLAGELTSTFVPFNNEFQEKE